MYYLTVTNYLLEVWNLKWVSLGRNPDVEQAVLLLEGLGDNLFSCLFQFLETTCIPWLMVPSSIFKASHSSVQFSPSVVSDSDPMDCSTPGLPVLHYLPEFAQTCVLWVSDTVQPSHPLSPPSPPAFSLSQHQGLFQWFGSWWPNYRSFSFSNSASIEHSGLIFFRIDWFDLHVVQGTLKSLLQCHSLKASILWRLAYFMVQFSHLYMTTGKTIALTRCTFVDKVMSLFFNTLSWFVIDFLPRSKSLNFMAAVTICSDFGAPPK